jgi:hypothetical protein
MEKFKAKTQVNDRNGERGAALITVIMISFLLLVAVAALLLEASTNAANVTDATAEEQAYYAAEGGIQTAVNILRHKPVPDPLIDTSQPSTAAVNQVTYRKAARPEDSNYPGDENTDLGIARLSRWMTYDDDSYPAGEGRVVLGSPADGVGYKVEVISPDNIGGVIAFYTQGSITGGVAEAGGGFTKWFPDSTSPNRVKLTYHGVPSASPTVVDVSSGEGATNFGKWEVTVFGTGAPIPSRVRFTINVNVTVPYTTSKNIRGYIEPVPAPATITPNSVGSLRIIYDSERYVTLGTLMSLTAPDPALSNVANTPGGSKTIAEEPPATPTGPFGTYVTGYRIHPYAPDVSGRPGQDGVGTTLVTGTFLSPEPIRLLIRSTGYAPRGAKKVLETVIQKNYFDDLGAPSPLTLIGPSTAPTAPTNFTFSPGNSRPIFYSGKDTQLRIFLPPIGVTNDTNLATVQTAITTSFQGAVFGSPENVNNDLPNWLQSPLRLDKTIKLLKARAQALGRYVGPTAPDPTNFGDYTTGTGITFVDRDVTIQNNTNAGGIIVVTGKITFQGGFNLKGLLVVTGKNGFARTGGGSGHVEGAIVVAPYNAAGLTCVANDTTCFLTPQYAITGGGASDFDYNSNSVANGLGALTDYVKGVAEK